VNGAAVDARQSTLGDETQETEEQQLLDDRGWRNEATAALVCAAACELIGFGLPVALAFADSSNPHAQATFQTLVTTKYATHVYMMLMLNGFALVHSGLASLRPKIAQIIGERAYRLGFALASLPLAVGTIAYFIAHRYDGAQLWTLQGIAGVHEFVYITTFLSFFLLYPATFNLLEVAAVRRPGFRIYEDGVMRITRHPQLWGQVLWCVAHSAWTGTSLPIVASAGLLAHHFVGAWNGDRRLRDRYGLEWEKYASRTSLVPFVAILDGRQKLNPKEFIRPAYVGVTAFVLATYAAHPLMLRVVGNLHL